MVTLINRCTVHGDTDEFERVFATSSVFMCSQPGFASHRLVRSLRNPKVYVNVAEWQSVAQHQAAVARPGFADHMKELAALAAVDPDLYTPVLERAAADA